MEEKQLQESLNKEYEGVGEITIREMHRETISSNDIRCISSILDKVDGLDDKTPIVVSKTYSRYKLIDGYHRLKYNLGKDIEVFVLDDYSIKRNSDTFSSFIEKTAGKTIEFKDSEILMVNSDMYFIESNEGCGGCANGWSSIDVKEEFLGEKIKVKTVETKEKQTDSDLYELIINKKAVALVDTGWGNGYYGGDFEITKVN